MAISNKTRKTLWGRSGNRCAMCRTELVAEANEYEKNLNIGDECHIVSEQSNGPRHIPDYNHDYDEYDNLILLCKNHHRTIDELWETYSIDLLKLIKANHENWIKTTIDKANNAENNSTSFLPRLTTGKQIFDLIYEAHAFHFNHDEFESQEEADLVAGFLQNLQDWGDILCLTEVDASKQIQYSFEFSNCIKQLEEKGFYVFGERKTAKIESGKNDEWEVVVILILHQKNPTIVNLEKASLKL